jgi:hypothetical protein
MNPELQAAIEGSKLLTDEQKKRFLSNAESLTAEQVKEALEILTKGEEKYSKLTKEHQEQELKIKSDYLADLKRVAPKIIKKIETSQRSQETSEADGLLSQLNNL